MIQIVLHMYENGMTSSCFESVEMKKRGCQFRPMLARRMHFLTWAWNPVPYSHWKILDTHGRGMMEVMREKDQFLRFISDRLHLWFKGSLKHYAALEVPAPPTPHFFFFLFVCFHHMTFKSDITDYRHFPRINKVHPRSSTDRSHVKNYWWNLEHVALTRTAK